MYRADIPIHGKNSSHILTKWLYTTFHVVLKE